MMVPKLSQAELSDKLGVSFQQIQKYEKGVNRMSAAMMVQIAAVLKVDVQYFFDELPTGAKNTKEIKTPILIDMSLAAHGPRLIDAFENRRAARCGHRSGAGSCQSALDWDPLSASNRDPFERRVRPVALAPSELAGVAETVRARVV